MRTYICNLILGGINCLSVFYLSNESAVLLSLDLLGQMKLQTKAVEGESAKDKVDENRSMFSRSHIFTCARLAGIQVQVSPAYLMG